MSESKGIRLFRGEVRITRRKRLPLACRAEFGNRLLYGSSPSTPCYCDRFATSCVPPARLTRIKDKMEWFAGHLEKARGMVAVTSFEAVVESGRIRLPANVQLPENARVYVVVPDIEMKLVGRVATPRLVHPDQAQDFAMEVVEEVRDAGV